MYLIDKAFNFQLIPTNIPLPTSGFFFYYSLLGNDVTNEAFFDLLNPTFPAERASVRLRSNVDVLRAFFSSQPGIEVSKDTLHTPCLVYSEFGYNEHPVIITTVFFPA